VVSIGIGSESRIESPGVWFNAAPFASMMWSSERWTEKNGI
jgi:hypothetical protein